MAAKKKPTKKPAVRALNPEAVRKKVLADPNTEAIAQSLGVDLEEYVKQVVDFVMHPGTEPSLYVVADEDLTRLGYPPPDADAMGQYIIDAVKVAEAGGKSGYEKKKKPLPSVIDLPQVGEEHTDSRLKRELEKSLKGKRKG